MASVSIYNHHRFARSSLKRSRKFDASLTIELYGDHWRFKGSDTVLEYDGPMRPFLIALRAQTIPSFMIPLLLEQEPKIPLNEGCLIIEVHDYRPPNHSQLDLVDKRKLGTNIYARNPFKNSRASQWGAGFGPSSSMPGVMGTASSSTAAGVASGSNGIIQPAQSSVSGETGEPSYIKNRIMMKPDSESLYETLLATHQSWNRDAAKNSHPPLEWDDNSILELEARILAAIAPPLSLDTSFLSTRVANLSSTLTVPTLPHMSADGSYIPRARRRELAYGKATIRDDDEDIEEDVANTNSDTAEDSKEQTTAHSAAVGETLGIGKKDWALLVFGTKKTSAASIQQSGRRPIDEQFFAARQARTRMDQKRPMNAAAAARPEPAPQPEQDVRQHNMNGPVRNGEGSVNSAGNDNGGDNGMAKKPKPKKKKKPIEPDSNEIIDVDAVSTVPVAMNGDADNGAGKGKLKPKPKLNAAAIKAAKKRNADEMDGEGTVAGSPATVDTSIAPTPTTMRPKPKKLTKKQQEALAKQQAAEAVAAAQAEPPRKKAKKAPVPHNASFNQNHQPVPGVPNGEAYSQYQDAGMGGFNGLPVNMNMGNIAMGSGIPGISQDDFLAAAEALGESMPGMMMDPPIQQQQFGAPDQMQMAMGNMMQTGGPQAMSRQPGGQSRAPHG